MNQNKKYPSPLKAIRKKCLNRCMLGQSNEARQCPSTRCALFKLRFGRKVEGISPVKAIRAQCIDCSEILEEVRNCFSTDCPIYPFRMGRNPNLSERGKKAAATMKRKVVYFSKTSLKGKKTELKPAGV